MFKASIISLVVLPLAATCALAQANTMTSGRPSAALNPEQRAVIWKNAVPSGDLLAQIGSRAVHRQLHAGLIRWERGHLEV